MTTTSGFNRCSRTISSYFFFFRKLTSIANVFVRRCVVGAGNCSVNPLYFYFLINENRSDFYKHAIKRYFETTYPSGEFCRHRLFQKFPQLNLSCALVCPPRCLAKQTRVLRYIFFFRILKILFICKCTA